jgi:hypothetical protein
MSASKLCERWLHSCCHFLRNARYAAYFVLCRRIRHPCARWTAAHHVLKHALEHTSIECSCGRGLPLHRQRPQPHSDELFLHSQFSRNRGCEQDLFGCKRSLPHYLPSLTSSPSITIPPPFPRPPSALTSPHHA